MWLYDAIFSLCSGHPWTAVWAYQLGCIYIEASFYYFINVEWYTKWSTVKQTNFSGYTELSENTGIFKTVVGHQHFRQSRWQSFLLLLAKSRVHIFLDSLNVPIMGKINSKYLICAECCSIHQYTFKQKGIISIETLYFSKNYSPMLFSEVYRVNDLLFFIGFLPTTATNSWIII